jgi:preprotein translocase subunit SecF
MTNPESLSGWTRLTTGTANVDIIGRRRTWYIGFGVLIAVCLLSLVFRGFNLGIDFTGGSQIQLPATGANGAISTQQVDRVYEGVIGFAPEVTQSVGSGDAASIVLQSEPLTPEQLVPLREALFAQLQPLGADGTPRLAGLGHLGRRGHHAGADRAGGVHRPGHAVPGVLLRAGDGRRGADRARQ